MRNDTGPAREMQRPFPKERPSGQPRSTHIAPLVRTFVRVEPPKGTKQVLDALEPEITRHIKTTIADYFTLAKASGIGGQNRIDWDIHSEVGIPASRQTEVTSAFHNRANTLLTNLHQKLRTNGLKLTPEVVNALNSRVQEQIIAAHDALVDGQAHALMDDPTESFALSHREIRGMTTHLAQQWHDKTQQATTLLQQAEDSKKLHEDSLPNFLLGDLTAPNMTALIKQIAENKWYYHLITPTQATSRPELLAGIAHHLAIQPTPNHPLLEAQKGESQEQKTARAQLQSKIQFFKRAATTARTIRELDKTITSTPKDESDLATLNSIKRNDHRIQGFENDVKLAVQRATDANDPLATAIALNQLHEIVQTKLSTNNSIRQAQQQVIQDHVNQAYLVALAKHARG